MSRVVEEARGWIGTPYLHQGSVQGAGCDCLGLVRGVWRGLNGTEPEVPPAYTQDWGEVGGAEVLSAAAHRWLRPVARIQPGVILLFRMRDRAVAKHLGICSAVGAHPKFIHAYSGHGVTETTLSDPWKRRIAGLFELPEPDRS